MYYARYQDVNVVSYELCQVPRKTASAQGDATHKVERTSTVDVLSMCSCCLPCWLLF